MFFFFKWNNFKQVDNLILKIKSRLQIIYIAICNRNGIKCMYAYVTIQRDTFFLYIYKFCIHCIYYRRILTWNMYICIVDRSPIDFLPFWNFYTMCCIYVELLCKIKYIFYIPVLYTRIFILISRPQCRFNVIICTCNITYISVLYYIGQQSLSRS